ncbi:hypothetical protein [Roseomonas elaeocarpi]|uniref:Lipoprotein n=1 Tax=Roseomonas elaeocarpi TaxID=907779 RepID=A0ABV6JSI6_9PROT
MLTLPLLLGCVPKEQLQSAALQPSSNAVALRQLQSRRFDTRDETVLLSASTGVLQDLGFTVDESMPAAGLLVGSKSRTAIEAQQIAGQMLLLAMAAALGARTDPTWDQDQRIRISIVVTPARDRAATVARVSFQRIVRNNRGGVSKVETMEDPQLYTEFFEMLSKSTFLQANQI